jgi:hypothetical protein
LFFFGSFDVAAALGPWRMLGFEAGGAPYPVGSR